MNSYKINNASVFSNNLNPPNVLSVILCSAAALVLLLTSIFGALWFLISGTLMLIPLTFLSPIYDSIKIKKRFDWTQQIIIVTGGSNGVGEQATKLFLSLGAKVAVLDINKPNYEFPQSQLKYYRCDAGNSKDVESTVKSISKELGTPTVLLNNVGIVKVKSFIDSSYEELDRVNSVTFSSHVYVTRAVLPLMIQNRKGHIISMASILSFSTHPKAVSYCAAKAAVHSFYEGLRQELGSRPESSNIEVSVVYPSHISTGMFAGVTVPKFLMLDITSEQVAEQVAKIIDGQKGKEMFIPKTGGLVMFYNICPRIIRDKVYLLFNNNSRLDNFKGNQW
ncbi:Short-chain dehydrogenase/reductase family 16C member 6 [Smittium culicis]|uniref:Short-chain dehydrogenase/reductase family 16C member 6 n=1 Tax=Smittium culicis TaxID=133412 RepID=A0A1R1XR91_9FUNG|nr:Short-chain dehydrogenase/reductase family 16C member 6 [Smittium culicis]